MLSLLDYVHNHPERFQMELKFLGNRLESDPSDLASPPVVCSIVVPPFFVALVASLLQIWLTSAHGEAQVLTERYKHNKLLVKLKAGSSYIDYITSDQLEQMEQWVEIIQNSI